jgi:peptidoglycan hydrolase-like protein with peptidoglycan-binding domain
MTITTKATAKVAAIATALAMATSMLSLAPMAHAQTGCTVGMTDLTVGSTGASVTCLQQGLILKGFSIPAGATGYFGLQTRAAVSAWQAAMGISPAAGYFGPISRGKWVNAGGTASGGVSTGCLPGYMFNPVTGAACGSTTGGGSSGLAGTDGMINDVTELGSFNDEEVGEGSEDVEVLGADIEASNDGDIALRSVRVSFDPTGNTGSDDLDDYLDSVSVWLDGDMIGESDVEDFSEDSADLWVRTITTSNAVIRADDTARLVVAVTAAGNIDSDDISGDSWTVDIENIRFEDGSGVVTTDSTTGDINGMDVDIDFTTFSESADTEVNITTDTDSPEAGIVIVDDNDSTDDVSLLMGRLEVEGDSDAVLDEFPVTFTATANGGTGTSLDDITTSVTLVIDGQEFTETMTHTGTTLVGTIVFDDLDLDIDAGDTVEFEVLADISDIDGTAFVEGATLKADVTATNRDNIDIENQEGDQIADSDKSGTAVGEAQEFRTEGISVDHVSDSAVSNDNDGADTGTFKVRFEVTAVGETVYVSSLVANAVDYVVDRSGTATSTGLSAVITNITDTDLTSVGNYEVLEGDSETFEVTVIVPLGAAATSGLYRMSITNVEWGTDDVVAPAENYTSNLEDLRTDYVFLDNA